MVSPSRLLRSAGRRIITALHLRGSSLARMRSLFAVFAVLVLVPAAGMVVTAPGIAPAHRAAALLGLAALAARYLRGCRTGRLTPWLDPLELAILVTVATAGGPDQTLGITYIGSYYRAFFGGWARVGVTSVVYFGAHALAVVLPHARVENTHDLGTVLFQFPTLVLGVSVMHLMARVSRRYDAALVREKILARVGGALVAATDRAGILTAGRHAARELAGEDAELAVSTDEDGPRATIAHTSTPAPERRALDRLAYDVTLALRSANLQAELARGQVDALYRSLIENASDVVTIMDEESVIAFQTPSIEPLLGYSPHELTGTRLIDLVHPEERDWVWAGYQAGLERPGTSAVPIVCRWRHRDGTWRWLEHKRNVLLDDPEVRAVVLNSRDVTERVALQDQLAHRAFHDGLTGLVNRALFTDRLDRAMALAHLRGQPLAVVFVDLDDFKRVNDSLGHGAGDEVLRTCALRLAAVVDEGDTVARFGGDEFAVLLESTTSREEAGLVAGDLLAALDQPQLVQGHRLALAGSAGIALVSGQEAGAEEVLRNADIALYRAKGDGKGRYRVYEPEMHAAALRRIELTDELRRAIAYRELVLHFQPIVGAADGVVQGVEALVRWQHPERGLLPPAAFIAAAEQAGLIGAMGEWILDEAVRQAAEWRRAGVGGGELWVAVNLSVEQLVDGELLGQVAGALARHDLPADRLVLELTESAVMRDVAAAAGRLAELKRLGVRIALDDFGEGYSSLAYLASLPLDVLKLPKSFVDPLAFPDGNAALARASVELARSFGLVTVGEGVEVPEQRERLVALGCELAQGYLFARPAGPDAIVAAAGGRVEVAAAAVAA